MAQSSCFVQDGQTGHPEQCSRQQPYFQAYDLGVLAFSPQLRFALQQSQMSASLLYLTTGRPITRPSPALSTPSTPDVPEPWAPLPWHTRSVIDLPPTQPLHHYHDKSFDDSMDDAEDEMEDEAKEEEFWAAAASAQGRPVMAIPALVSTAQPVQHALSHSATAAVLPAHSSQPTPLPRPAPTHPDGAMVSGAVTTAESSRGSLSARPSSASVASAAAVLPMAQVNSPTPDDVTDSSIDVATAFEGTFDSKSTRRVLKFILDKDGKKLYPVQKNVASKSLAAGGQGLEISPSKYEEIARMQDR